VRELENICERMAAFFSQWEDKEKIAFDELHHDCPDSIAPMLARPTKAAPDSRASGH
jgi:propionate catabolism operon transcriptional regulator